MNRLFKQSKVAWAGANKFIARFDPDILARAVIMSAPGIVLKQAAILPPAVAALPLSSPGWPAKLLI
jgi:hypothetical protein